MVRRSKRERYEKKHTQTHIGGRFPVCFLKPKERKSQKDKTVNTDRPSESGWIHSETFNGSRKRTMLRFLTFLAVFEGFSIFSKQNAEILICQGRRFVHVSHSKCTALKNPPFSRILPHVFLGLRPFGTPCVISPLLSFEGEISSVVFCPWGHATIKASFPGAVPLSEFSPEKSVFPCKISKGRK